MKSVFTVLVKKSGTEEFDLIKILKSSVWIFVTHCHSCMLSVDAIHHQVGKSNFWDAWMSFSKSTELTYTFIRGKHKAAGVIHTVCVL